MDPGKDGIRLTYNLGGETVIRNGMGTFLGQQVTTLLALLEGEVTIATAKVVELATYQPQVTAVFHRNRRSSGYSKKTAEIKAECLPT